MLILAQCTEKFIGSWFGNRLLAFAGRKGWKHAPLDPYIFRSSCQCA